MFASFSTLWGHKGDLLETFFLCYEGRLAERLGWALRLVARLVGSLLLHVARGPVALRGVDLRELEVCF